jgi:hypothetical protein
MMKNIAILDCFKNQIIQNNVFTKVTCTSERAPHIVHLLMIHL